MSTARPTEKRKTGKAYACVGDKLSGITKIKSPSNAGCCTKKQTCAVVIHAQRGVSESKHEIGGSAVVGWCTCACTVRVRVRAENQGCNEHGVCNMLEYVDVD